MSCVTYTDLFLYIFCNILFQPLDYPFFKARDIALTYPEHVGNLFLRFFRFAAEPVAHFHNLLFTFAEA